MELHLPVAPQYNQFTNQYHQKRFNNKHTKSTWRHHHQKKYYKKSLKHKQKISIKDYLLMNYNDEMSVYQQKLQHNIENMECSTCGYDSRYKMENGKVIRNTTTSTPQYLRNKKQKYQDSINQCIAYIKNIMSDEYYHNNYHDLLDL
eukprot:890731_1